MKNIKYATYTEISPERDITANAFSKGQINFFINNSSMYRWNPYKSYLRMRLRLSKINGEPLDISDNIAPNMFQGDCFWQQMNMKCAGTVISSIDDYVPQVSALKNRYSITEGRRTGLLSYTNFAQSSFGDRQQQIINEGYIKKNSSINQFTTLADNAGVDVLTTEEIRVLGGALNIIEYNNANAVGIGAVDLTESVLKVGDIIHLNQALNPEFTANITNITASTITVDRNMTAFATQDILKNLIRYESIDTSISIPSRRIKDYELCFRPSMGFFSIDDYLAGNYKLELTPHSNTKFKKYVIESLIDKDPDTDYDLSVIDLQLYIWKGMTKSPVTKNESYAFSEIRCQAQTITSSSLLNKSFAVNKNSYAFSIAYQKPNSGDDTSFSKSKFKMLNEYEKQIKSYQLRINGETLPQRLPSIDTQSSLNRDFATQQYYEMLHYNGTIFLDEPEPLAEWFERGAYYTYRLKNQLNEGSNRLYVSSEFRGTAPENFLLLVFDHYYASFSMSVENGMVSKCKNITDLEKV